MLKTTHSVALNQNLSLLIEDYALNTQGGGSLEDLSQTCHWSDSPSHRDGSPCIIQEHIGTHTLQCPACYHAFAHNFEQCENRYCHLLKHKKKIVTTLLVLLNPVGVLVELSIQDENPPVQCQVALKRNNHSIIPHYFHMDQF